VDSIKTVSVGLLWTRQWTFVLHKKLESSWVAVQLATSQEGLMSTELFFFQFLGPLFGLLYQPHMTYECGAVGGMIIGRGNRNTRRNPAPVLLCPPQISPGLLWDRTRGRRGGIPATNGLSCRLIRSKHLYLWDFLMAVTYLVRK
jgi:hypothetical protein